MGSSPTPGTSRSPRPPVWDTHGFPAPAFGVVFRHGGFVVPHQQSPLVGANEPPRGGFCVRGARRLLASRWDSKTAAMRTPVGCAARGGLRPSSATAGRELQASSTPGTPRNPPTPGLGHPRFPNPRLLRGLPSRGFRCASPTEFYPNTNENSRYAAGVSLPVPPDTDSTGGAFSSPGGRTSFGANRLMSVWTANAAMSAMTIPPAMSLG